MSGYTSAVPAARTPEQLTHEELIALVRTIRQELWPGGRWDSDWDSDTLGEIGNAMVAYGLDPLPPKEEEEEGAAESK